MRYFPLQFQKKLHQVVVDGITIKMEIVSYWHVMYSGTSFIQTLKIFKTLRQIHLVAVVGGLKRAKANIPRVLTPTIHRIERGRPMRFAYFLWKLISILAA